MSLCARRVTLPAITPLLLQKRVIKVFNEDGTSRAIEVPNDITALNVCQLLIHKNHYIDDQNWTMFEQLSTLCLERIIEDHEMVIEVQSKWDMEEDCRFCVRKYYAKYEFFKNPENYFPDLMLSYSSEMNGTTKPVDILKMLLSTSTYPEIHSYLYMAEKGKKSWKKLFFILRRSGLYFSTKGTSKEPRHLQFFCDFPQSNIYMLLSARKSYGAPTDFGFCLKPNKTGGAKEMKLLCAETEESKICWLTAIRLYKHGKQIYQNYMRPQQKSDGSSQNLAAMRSISENSLVAMDFSGHKSRVIENPTEVLSIALQEGLLWRRKSSGRINVHGINTSSQNSTMNLAVHMSQPWFHHKISRDEAQKLICQQGLVNGVFLVRDSQSAPKSFVLSMCHGQKIKHFQISPIEDGGELYYTLDEGHTRFTDLTQLVEFHQLNKGILPCTLKHYCTRVTV
ncbi:PREDICTED: growth factor receptor-bound protein 14 isoform X1 [Nanorana parkeri]|uniref:growth factor receptor-bound protein 14 isoform X1 n=1 Tax=Nanorana parkeri TaxID=125878 RepID=UPI000854A87E|nr:PREDICTED: growth factor receptor-bound protein 14 isoform X1 [Nanorana parkeri]